MGLFSFIFKVGIVAYTIDYFHTKCHEYRGNYQSTFHRAIEDASSSAQETTPKVRQWLHEAREAWYSQDNGTAEQWPGWRNSRFKSHRHGNTRPEISSTDLPNGRTSLEIDVPGISKENLVLTVNEHEKTVILSGKNSESSSSTAAGGSLKDGGRRERRVEARIKLPATADVSDLKANIENGVLRVDIGKKEFEGRRIEIQ
ncbi:hypothetical protein HK100_005874 [Physocladia obscura]|uniref:SHSP domain-containing protein n=1 Tax=Physocladia obscura TaxID=109957 RepID=A0AAD5TBG2_9FUNG|nr:hypothetical protein HK100_005874 [Physocladia obscura]